MIGSRDADWFPVKLVTLTAAKKERNKDGKGAKTTGLSGLGKTEEKRTQGLPCRGEKPMSGREGANLRTVTPAISEVLKRGKHLRKRGGHIFGEKQEPSEKIRK